MNPLQSLLKISAQRSHLLRRSHQALRKEARTEAASARIPASNTDDLKIARGR